MTFRWTDFHEARNYAAWSHGDLLMEFHISRSRDAEIRWGEIYLRT